MHIVIGFSGNKGIDGAKTLYLGEDRGAALEKVNSPGKGIGRVEFYSHPQCNQRKFYEQPAPTPKKAAKKEVEPKDSE